MRLEDVGDRRAAEGDAPLLSHVIAEADFDPREHLVGSRGPVRVRIRVRIGVRVRRAAGVALAVVCVDVHTRALGAGGAGEVGGRCAVRAAAVDRGGPGEQVVVVGAGGREELLGGREEGGRVLARLGLPLGQREDRLAVVGRQAVHQHVRFAREARQAVVRERPACALRRPQAHRPNCCIISCLPQWTQNLECSIRSFACSVSGQRCTGTPWLTTSPQLGLLGQKRTVASLRRWFRF
jgi:hypothetical protein